MCDLNKEFILCSCDGEELDYQDIGWILKRKDNNKEIQYVRGKPAMNFLEKKEEKLKTILAQRLNSSNYFDFEYKPQEDDFLRIRTKAGSHNWFAFRFVNGQWIEDDSTSFDEWRMQLEPYHNGKVKKNA